AHGQAPRTGQPAITAALDIETPPVVARSVRLGHTRPDRVLHISVSLTPADSLGLQAYADSVSNPVSPNYRKFLAPEQVGEIFGVSQAAVNRVVDYLKSKGFTIRLVAKNRLSVLADATVAQAEAAFVTRIDDFSARNPNEAGNPRFYSFSQQ